MSQQEFEPQQNVRPSYNESVQADSSESEARPYYWSTKQNTGNIPKNEHPANFEDSVASLPPIPPYSYQAQDRPMQGTQGAQYITPPPASQQQGKQQQRFGPDGDALEHGYRPYNTYNMQAPPWARQQRSKKAWRMFALIVLGFFLIRPLLLLLGGLIVAFGVILIVVLSLAVGAAIIGLFFFLAFRGSLPFARSRRRRWGGPGA